MSYSSGSMNRLSGQVLPLILLEKIQREKGETATAADAPLHADSCSAEDRDRIFTANDIENELWRTSQALTDVQRQISRGEEVYYEETQSTSGFNLYQGWNGFIDSNFLSGGSNHNGVQGGGGGGTRRMPNDFRWFSGSAASMASRHLKPEPMGSRVSSVVSNKSASASVSRTTSAAPSITSASELDSAKFPSNTTATATAATSVTAAAAAAVVLKAAPSAEPKKESASATKEQDVINDKDVDMVDEETKDKEPEASAPSNADESKRDKRKAPSESASDSATKKGKDSAPRRTKRKRRSGGS